MLSKNAQQLIDRYFNLPFKDIRGIRCPYFNNKKRQQRGQLRVLIGKGLPAEIVEEAKITSIQYGDEVFDYKGNCQSCSDDKTKKIRKYLIDHDLGIDCSGYVVHVLREHFKETKNFDFTSNLEIVSKKRIFRYFITKLRRIENINVKVLTNNNNTKIIRDIGNIKEGDIVTMLTGGPDKKRDHILLVTDVKDNIIKYTHARAWSNEGQYGHGISVGEIQITNSNKSILEQEWVEKEKKNEKNETYLEAKNAKVLEVRRIKFV